MSRWHPQHFEKAALEAGASFAVVRSAVAAGNAVIVVDPDLPPVFTLRHLAQITNTPYAFLRDIVARDSDPYRSFRIAKSVTEDVKYNFRLISVPDFYLMRVQRWLAANILARGHPHAASGAYAPGSDIKRTASLHCRAKWLIKLDIKQFFESISEIAAYRVFREFGYQPLIAFEFSRLCTRQRKTLSVRSARWHPAFDRRISIPAYWSREIGYLPQGAPTSPMIANLSVRSLDEKIAAVAERHDLTYTRYADDLSLSTRRTDFSRAEAAKVIGEVYDLMGSSGFSPNLTKTHVLPPGSRKIVLGLLVDGSCPRLTREFRARLRMHLHYLKLVGPVEHQRHRKFISVRSLRNHIEGMVHFAHHIDAKFAKLYQAKLATINWPL